MNLDPLLSINNKSLLLVLLHLNVIKYKIYVKNAILFEN